jgi:hypothetical protein
MAYHQLYLKISKDEVQSIVRFSVNMIYFFIFFIYFLKNETHGSFLQKKRKLRYYNGQLLCSSLSLSLKIQQLGKNLRKTISLERNYSIMFQLKKQQSVSLKAVAVLQYLALEWTAAREGPPYLATK